MLSEIISTEQDYVRDMNIIVNVFLKGDHNLEAHDVTALFGPIETVAPVNAQLLAGLQELFELPPAEQAVGKLFLRSVRDSACQPASLRASQPALVALTTWIRCRPTSSRSMPSTVPIKAGRSTHYSCFASTIQPLPCFCRYASASRSLVQQHGGAITARCMIWRRGRRCAKPTPSVGSSISRAS